MPASDSPPKRAPVIIVHGGAWAIPQELTARTLTGVERAAQVGHSTLLRHGSALDAVEAAIRELEDDVVFDAGRGSVLNADGAVEMDAAVMTGTPLRAGGVAAVGSVKNPVSLARRVYESEHVLLVGAGAERFAREVGVAAAGVADLVTEGAREEWRRFDRYGRVVETLFGCDTVGAAALDEAGGLACGTSTGGITYKRAGRVGDSAIVGAGLYAEAGLAAASCTGHGESILMCGLARGVVEAAAGGAADAARRGVSAMMEKTGGRGGVVCVDSKGGVGWDFTTRRMAYALVARDGVLRSGIDKDTRE